LNSLDENKFKSYGIICQKLEIVIDNGDNQPLNLDSIEIKGYEHMLIGRFNPLYTLENLLQLPTTSKYEFIVFLSLTITML